MTNFFDVLLAPIRAAESVVNGVIGLPKSIIHDLSSAGAKVVHDAVTVPKTLFHEGAQLGSNIVHDVGGTVQGLGKSADHALDAMSKNLILPLTVGGVAVVFFMLNQKR